MAFFCDHQWTYFGAGSLVPTRRCSLCGRGEVLTLRPGKPEGVWMIQDPVPGRFDWQGTYDKLKSALSK